jgi:RNA polymerase sigma factor (TIGR02999 family)
LFIGNPSQLLPIVPPMNVAKIPINDISVQDGQDFGNLADVLPIVYEELRRLARAKIAGEAPGNTLQTTALVHEAFVKIANYHGGLWRSERDFVAAAAQAMRQILVDRARAKHAARRGGGATKVPDTEFEQYACPNSEKLPEVLLVDRALEQLESQDPEKTMLVKLKYFVGLSLEECAAAMGISRSSAYRQWNCARVLLKQLIDNELKA